MPALLVVDLCLDDLNGVWWLHIQNNSLAVGDMIAWEENHVDLHATLFDATIQPTDQGKGLILVKSAKEQASIDVLTIYSYNCPKPELQQQMVIMVAARMVIIWSVLFYFLTDHVCLFNDAWVLIYPADRIKTKKIYVPVFVPSFFYYQ